MCQKVVMAHSVGTRIKGDRSFSKPEIAKLEKTEVALANLLSCWTIFLCIKRPNIET